MRPILPHGRDPHADRQVAVAIEFRELRWAIVASEHRSLRRAAETLNVRQSTLSRRLRELESALGAQLFDRHLISLTDDYRLLVSHNKVPSELRSLFARQMDRIHLPKDSKLWPHPGYIAQHRGVFSDV